MQQKERTNDYRIHCFMNDFHKDNKMRRDKAQKTTHLDYIYTYKAQEQAKLIYGNKNKNSGHLW